MGNRFFVAVPITSQQTVLSGTEAHHLQHVMRAAVGDEITLFDGSGQEFTARINRIKRTQIELVVISKRAVSREAKRQFIVGVALPKGDRQRWLIEKLTEIGAAQVVPLQTERSVVHPNQRSLKKLGRFVVEASKQCGRNHLMEITALTDLASFLAAAPSTAERWLADPAGNPPPGNLGQETATVYLAVGPEGGFSTQERNGAEAAGWQSVSLGPRILRIETACAVMATLASSDLRAG